MEFKKYRTNATTRFFEILTKFVYIITSNNFWFEDDHLPANFVKIYKSISKYLEAFLVAYAYTSLFARYTQDNLTEKQNTELLMRSLGIFFVYTTYCFTVYRKGTIKELLFTLTVTLKGLYNNETVERKMLKKCWMYVAGLVVVDCSTNISVGVSGAVKAITSNATFTTIIPIWPDIENRSLFAGFVRILIFIIILLLASRVLSVFSIIICTSICLGYQFANLCEYFSSLNDIFDGEGSQEEKEIKYEKAVKVGIKMHTITLNCVDQLQSSCSVAYSVEITQTVGGMAIILIQIVQAERSLGALAPILLTAVGVLLLLGLFSWSAGDITVEAERLPTAMFHSGWHNCTRQSSVRVRKMITIAMAQAQQVVVLKGLFIIEMSYASYITIVKSSYSVFSVLY